LPTYPRHYSSLYFHVQFDLRLIQVRLSGSKKSTTIFKPITICRSIQNLPGEFTTFYHSSNYFYAQIYMDSSRVILIIVFILSLIIEQLRRLIPERFSDWSELLYNTTNAFFGLLIVHTYLHLNAAISTK